MEKKSTESNHSRLTLHRHNFFPRVSDLLVSRGPETCLVPGGHLRLCPSNDPIGLVKSTDFQAWDLSEIPDVPTSLWHQWIGDKNPHMVKQGSNMGM
jgi:hypothetical protein